MARTIASTASDRTSRLLFILALAFALGAAVLVFTGLSRRGGDRETRAPVTAAVVVARENVSARTKLTEQMLEVRQVPVDLALPGVFNAATPLVGQVTRYPMVAGEQVTAAKVGPQEKEEEGLSFVVPPGKRAMAVSVTEVSGVGGLLLPGDMVDIIAILTNNDVGADKAVTILQNIEVLAVAQAAQEPLPPSQAIAEEETAPPEDQTLAARPQDAKPQPDARTVTLALTPQEAQLLALAQDKGKLVLSLRRFGEDEQVPLEEQTLLPLRIP